jgi:hypothetical protein
VLSKIAFSPEKVQRYTATAAAAGLSKRQVVEAAIHEYAVARGVKVRRSCRKSPELR